jgi:hypothetical protein
MTIAHPVLGAAPEPNGLPPLIAAHLAYLRRDVDAVRAEQRAQDEKLDLVLERVAALQATVGTVAERLTARHEATGRDNAVGHAYVGGSARSGVAGLAAARRPSWLVVAVVGAVCSTVVGPILAVIARAIIAAQPGP